MDRKPCDICLLHVTGSAVSVHLKPLSPPLQPVSDLSAVMVIKAEPAVPVGLLLPGLRPCCTAVSSLARSCNKLCIQTVDATNGAVHWTNTGD